ncbi:MAG: type II secretion system protein [Vibrio sp.]
MKNIQGFTLIELVIVIVILGILSVFAAPKFLGISRDAKIATLETMEATLRTGAKMVYAKAVIQGKDVGADKITVDNATIDIHSGYPQGTWVNSIRYIVGLDNVNFSKPNERCRRDWCGRGNQLRTPSGKTSTRPGSIVKIYSNGFRWRDECGVYYINHADGREPEIGIESKDC